MVSCVRRVVVGALSIACVLAAGVAAQTPATTEKPKVKAVTAMPITSVEGKDNYDAYCAVCHGTAAKGDGPAAPAMKAPVPDLTTIAKRHDGKFQPAVIEMIVKGTGRTPTPAHGVDTMPIWGDVFHSEEPTRALLRMRNLVRYLESIQVK